MNTIRKFFENLTIKNDKYHLFGNEFNCIINDTNMIDEDDYGSEKISTIYLNE